jgi:hypothetical protein
MAPNTDKHLFYTYGRRVQAGGLTSGFWFFTTQLPLECNRMFAQLRKPETVTERLRKNQDGSKIHQSDLGDCNTDPCRIVSS